MPPPGTIRESISTLSLYRSPKSPAVSPVVERAMLEAFVRLSDAESPESSEAERSGALAASGAVKSTFIVVPALAADVLPAESTTT